MILNTVVDRFQIDLVQIVLSVALGEDMSFLSTKVLKVDPEDKGGKSFYARVSSHGRIKQI